MGKSGKSGTATRAASGWRPSAAVSMVAFVTLGALAFAGYRLLTREPTEPKPGAKAGSGPAAASQPAGEEVREVEPNDSRTACQLLPRGANLLVRGQLADGNEDWYCPASPGFAANLKLVLSGVPGCDTGLEVVDSQGRPLKTAVATGPGQPRVIDNSGADLAARAIVVRPKPGCRDEKGVGYELRVEVLKTAAVDWEKEPNDVPDKPNPMRRGTVMVGFLSRDTDVDAYALPTQPAPSDSRLRVEAVPLPSLALRLEVRGADGGLLYKAAGEPGQALTVRGLGVRSWEGQVLIMVAAGAGAGPRRAYTLRGELETVGGPFEFEPNEDPRAATPLPLVPGEGLLVSGYLSTVGDVDCYGVSPMQTTPVALSVEEIPAGLRPTATLLDARGAVVASCQEGAACQGRPATPGRIELVLERPARASYVWKITADEGRYDDLRPYRVRARYLGPGAGGRPAGAAAGPASAPAKVPASPPVQVRR